MESSSVTMPCSFGNCAPNTRFPGVKDPSLLKCSKTADFAATLDMLEQEAALDKLDALARLAKHKEIIKEAANATKRE
eukprot:12277082-Karenia_brevis.AAC.1